MNQYACLLCSFISSVDDTVLVKTCILSEILGKDDDSCTELVLDPHARRALVYLLAGQTTKYFSPDLIALLNVRSAFLEQTSKKDATVRRRELLAVVVPRLASMMAASPTAAVDELMREISGCQLVLETMKGADEGQEAAVVGSLLSLLQPIYMKQAADDDAEKQQGVNGDEEESESDSDEEDEEDANEEKAETETPLEPSKHYVASKAAELAPVKVKAYLLFDQTASKYLKKMMAECPTFANRLGSALVEHEVVAKLAEMDLAALQSGPFFVHVNTLERLAESGDNKVHAALVKAMKKHLMPLVDSAPENKGLAFLNKMLTAAPVAGK